MGNDSGAELPFCSFVRAGGRGAAGLRRVTSIGPFVSETPRVIGRLREGDITQHLDVMDVKDAAGNILLLATLLWRVSDGLGRDYADLHMLAPDLILPLWCG